MTDMTSAVTLEMEDAFMPLQLFTIEQLNRMEHRLQRNLVQPVDAPNHSHLALLDRMLEFAGALYLVRQEIQRRNV